MAASKQQRNRDGLYLDGSPPDKEAQMVAETAIRPSVQAAVTLKSYTKGIFDDLDLTALAVALSDQANATEAGKLSQSEAMLTAQAPTLDAIFNNLARCANSADRMALQDRYLRLALRAQSQCRATWETLAAIQNPPMVGYVRQANIAHGPQQVINTTAGPSEPPRTREKDLKNELLENQNGERLGFGTAGAAGRADTELAPVGTINRAKNRRR